MLVDDDPNLLAAIKRILKKEQWEIDAFTVPQEALAQLEKHEYNVILSDYYMPEMNGVSFFEYSKAKQKEAIRIILSGQADKDAVMNAINRAEIYRFICKPCNTRELIMTIKGAIEYNQLLKENKRLANVMREQESKLLTQQKELERLENENPGITKVNWDEEL